MQIIPAIDIIAGKCVRLTEGDFSRKIIYNEDPVEVALKFQDNAITRLHLVDLDGARAGQIINYKVLENIAAKTNLIIDFSGGIKGEKDLEQVFNSGAQIATVGSIAVKDPDLFFNWIGRFGNEKILLGADVKDEKIAVAGWVEKTDISIFDFVKQNIEKGVNRIFCTDISKDGKMEGPSSALYQKLREFNPSLELIASGGVCSMNDLNKLKEIGCSGAIIGKAIYEGKIKLSELSIFNIQNKIC